MFRLISFANYRMVGQPAFYMESITNEEKLKRICDKLWKVIEYLDQVKAVLDNHDPRIENLEIICDDLRKRVSSLEERATLLEERATAVEARATSLEERATAAEAEIDEIQAILAVLDQTILSIIKEYVRTDEYAGLMTEVIAKDPTILEIISNISENSENISDNAADILENSGKIQENLDAINSINLIIVEINAEILAIKDRISLAEEAINLINENLQKKQDKVVDPKVNSVAIIDEEGNSVEAPFGIYKINSVDEIILTNKGYYYAENSSIIITVDGVDYRTSLILNDFADSTGVNGDVIHQACMAKAPTGSDIVLITRYFNPLSSTYSDWKIITNSFIESDLENAVATSLENPSALVYVPEDDEE